MKRFITATLGIAVFCAGVGALAEKAAARFKSDEKALEIISRARAAIGGESAVAGITSLIIKGQTANTLTIDGVDRVENGETEIALQMPDMLMKNVRIGKVGDIPDGEGMKTFDVVIGDDDASAGAGERKKFVLRRTDGGDIKEIDGGDAKIFVRKAGGTAGEIVADASTGEVRSADGKKFTIVRKESSELRDENGNVVMARKIAPEGGQARHNEMLRTTLALLVTSPQGMDVSYSYAGDTTIEGTAVSTVIASFAGASFKLYFDRSSFLPVAVGYVGHPSPVIVKMRRDGGDASPGANVVAFTRKESAPQEDVETLVRFADHRAVNGVLLPHRWTTTVGGKVTEVLDVTSYEVNPANITDKFKGARVVVRQKD